MMAQENAACVTHDSHCHDLHGHDNHEDHCHDGHCHDHHEEASEVSAETIAQASETRAIYRIPNMDCPMEEALIRKRLESVPGIESLQFNLMQRVLTVDIKPGIAEEVESALRSIDMIPERLGANEKATPVLPQARIPWKKLGLATGLAAFAEVFELMAEWQARPLGIDLPSVQVGGWPIMEILSFVLALCAIAMAGLGTFRKGWLAISNFNLNINALMAVAVTGAVLIGQFPEAAMVMVLFNISEAIEARALDHARKAIKDLLDLAPKLATVQMPDGSWQEINPAEIKIGSLVRVKPGEKIALDGEVTAGESAVNQAPITGESIAADKKPGDVVFAGTINETGSLEYRTTASANDTTLARIIHVVEEAQNTRAPMQRFVDVFAKYYTPAVFLFALAWAALPLFINMSWYDSIYTGLVILVIGCPCALVISTPVTVVSGMAAATRRGILIKGGLYLEQGRKLNWLALDKTGTLTWGKPRLTNFVNLGSLPPEKARLIGASLATRSDHPVSRAIAEAEPQDITFLKVENFSAIPGKGVTGAIDGETWHLGNFGLVKALGMESTGLQEQIENLEKQGNTVVALADPEQVMALFTVADTVKPSSIEAVHELRKLGVETMMLTGDNEHTARAIADEVGINEFRANLLPQQKLDIIEKLEQEGNSVGMVGDGINDAPALAKANIGFAMAAGGSDTAIETADVALMDDDLRKIPRFISLSRSTHAILIENIALALGIKTIFFILTLTGNATMWMAVFADVGAALIVVANGLRLMRK